MPPPSDVPSAASVHMVMRMVVSDTPLVMGNVALGANHATEQEQAGRKETSRFRIDGVVQRRPTRPGDQCGLSNLLGNLSRN
jgi:hypothetical protein